MKPRSHPSAHVGFAPCARCRQARRLGARRKAMSRSSGSNGRCAETGFSRSSPRPVARRRRDSRKSGTAVSGAHSSKAERWFGARSKPKSPAGPASNAATLSGQSSSAPTQSANIPPFSSCNRAGAPLIPAEDRNHQKCDSAKNTKHMGRRSRKRLDWKEALPHRPPRKA